MWIVLEDLLVELRRSETHLYSFRTDLRDRAFEQLLSQGRFALRLGRVQDGDVPSPEVGQGVGLFGLALKAEQGVGLAGPVVDQTQMPQQFIGFVLLGPGTAPQTGLSEVAPLPGLAGFCQAVFAGDKARIGQEVLPFQRPQLMQHGREVLQIASSEARTLWVTLRANAQQQSGGGAIFERGRAFVGKGIGQAVFGGYEQIAQLQGFLLLRLDTGGIFQLIDFLGRVEDEVQRIELFRKGRTDQQIVQEGLGEMRGTDPVYVGPEGFTALQLDNGRGVGTLMEDVEAALQSVSIRIKGRFEETFLGLDALFGKIPRQHLLERQEVALRPIHDLAHLAVGQQGKAERVEVENPFEGLPEGGLRIRHQLVQEEVGDVAEQQVLGGLKGQEFFQQIPDRIGAFGLEAF